MSQAGMTSLMKPKEEPSIWWRQLKAGNRKGLESLYSAYVEEMYRYGMGIKCNSSFVKDCIQEVFLSLWKYKSTLKETDQIKLYLFKCLSNKIHRESCTFQTLLHTENMLEFEHLNAVESIENDWINIQGYEVTRKKLFLALGKLPLRQKEIIQLMFFENLSYEEISTTMNINTKSVYTLAWKAISNLRRTMVVMHFMLHGYILYYLF